MTGASEATKAHLQRISARLAFHDARDFEDAQRGFIATLTPGVIGDVGGRVVSDLDAYSFGETEEAPDTVNPSLWRQFRLLMKHGLLRTRASRSCCPEMADGYR